MQPKAGLIVQKRPMWCQYQMFTGESTGRLSKNYSILQENTTYCNGYLFYRDTNGEEEEELGTLYANEVKEVCDKLEKEGRKPGCYIAESLQSCGGRCTQFFL